MSKLRIAYLCDSNFKLDSRPQKEVATLLKNGYEVTVLSWDRTKGGGIEQQICRLNGQDIMINYVCIKGYNGGTLKNMALAMFKYEKILIKWLMYQKNNYDLIYACNFNTAFFALKLARIFKKKIIYDIYDYYVDCHSYTREGSLFRNIIEKCDIKIINQADAVIICSEKRKEQIKKATPRLLEVIHNSPEERVYETEQYQNKYCFSSPRIKIAYIGYLEPGRPVKLLADIVAADKRLELHCAGYGPEAKAIKQMEESHNNIFFYGEICYDEAIFIEKNCDIIPALYNPTLANHKYAAPNKFYEALMLGKPVIMVKNTGMDDMVKKYNLGEICECNFHSIYSSIEKLIQTKKSWKEISKRNRSLYLEKFSWLIMEKKLIKVIEKVSA